MVIPIKVELRTPAMAQVNCIVQTTLIINHSQPYRYKQSSHRDIEISIKNTLATVISKNYLYAQRRFGH